MSDVQPEPSSPAVDGPEPHAASVDPAAEAGSAQTNLDVAQTAERLTDMAEHALDSEEVARQIEELTSVVLDSAEVSTRSASIAADVSASMRAVVTNIQESNRRSVLHSRIMLGAFIAALVVAMAVFFGITLRMTKSIKELDTMVYAMAKRVLEVDASLTAISKTQTDYSGLTEKQEELIVTQTRLASRVDEIGRALDKMPMNMADQANKLIDPKFILTGKQLQTLESRLLGLDAKLQAVEGKTGALEQKLEGKLGGIDSKLQALTSKASSPAGSGNTPTQQELHKLKQEMDAARQASERAAAKANEKAEAALAAANKASASERAIQSERQANQRAAAEQAALERSRPAPSKPAERPSAPKVDRTAMEKAAAERAEAARAAENERLQREQAAQEARRQQYPRFPAPPAEGN